jgi:hypothetical protein
MKELFESIIHAVYMSQDKDFLVFLDATGRRFFSYEIVPYCCDTCIFEPVKDLGNLIGNKINSISIAPSYDAEPRFDNIFTETPRCVLSCGYCLGTNKGEAEIRFRNISNRGFDPVSIEYRDDVKIRSVDGICLYKLEKDALKRIVYGKEDLVLIDNDCKYQLIRE